MDINRLFESLSLKYLSYLHTNVLSGRIKLTENGVFEIFRLLDSEIDKTINCETDMSFEQTLNGALSDFEMNEHIIGMRKS